MKITYSGYYGAKNSGDDAFNEVAAWGTRKYWGCTDHLFFSAELPGIITPASFFSPYKSYLNFSKAIYEVFKADIFLSAGGSTFHSALNKTDLRSYAKLKKSIFKNSSAGAIGVSLGPYLNTAAEKDIISYLQQLDFLALRDKYSFDLASSYNLPYKPVEAFDLAALLPLIYNDASGLEVLKPTEKIIGISVCNYERYINNGDLSKEEHRNKYIEDLLLQLIKYKDVKFRFFIFNGNASKGDQEITNQLIHKLELNGMLNFEIIQYLANVKLTWQKIAECNLIISTRLHASIFACFAEIPFFLMEYHRKCTDFLDDVGQHKDYRLFDGERNIEEVVEAVGKILYDSNYTPPIRKAISTDKAMRNFTHTYLNV